jgi:lipopolysaccharide transport system permease protein
MKKSNFFLSLFQNHSLIFELIKREFSSRYIGSFGGIFWSFAQPLFMFTIYMITFGVLFKTSFSPSESASDYALLMLAGLIIFNAISEVITKSPTLITSNPNFVKKVVFPLDLLPVTLVLLAIINAFISLSIWLIGYMFLIGTPKATVLIFPLILFCFLPLLLGLGWALSSIGVVIKDISQITYFLTQALLFLTPIFYSVNTAPYFLQKLLMINPLTFIVEQCRLVLFYGQIPSLKGLAIYFILTTIFASFSLLLFRRLRRNFADLV